MLPTTTRLILFTDLDGCLLNKHDYDWSPAASTLKTLRQRQIPVVMNSSKTVPEMSQLSDELGLAGSTFISENGSVIRWGREPGSQEGEIEIVGASRDRILTVLGNLKAQFRFRSFVDLGLVGVIKATQLSGDKAQMALDRRGTEPLLWDDTEAHRVEFERALHGHQLTLTKGGASGMSPVKRAREKGCWLLRNACSDRSQERSRPLVTVPSTKACSIWRTCLSASPHRPGLESRSSLLMGSLPASKGLLAGRKLLSNC